MQTEVLIIGGGLSGLVSALRLHQNNIDFLIVEARPRLGGRIHTQRPSGSPAIEMGATWLGAKHTQLTSLLSELGIDTFPQLIGDRAIYEPISTSAPYLAQLPPNPQPSLRIRGGSDTLIYSLANQVPQRSILKNQKITEIEKTSNHIVAYGPGIEIKADKIISTLPPYLFAHSIKCTPPLPSQIRNICQATHTWMGESIKIALSFTSPFWKKENSSGTIFSNVGPIPEMYDHSNYDENHYALMGFLNGNYHQLTKAERLELILAQLTKYYGSIASNPLHYEEAVWRQEPYTYIPYDKDLLPHQNNGHPIFAETFLEGKLMISGTETSATYPGYMEGQWPALIERSTFVFKLKTPRTCEARTKKNRPYCLLC